MKHHAYDKAIEFDQQNLDAWYQKGNTLFDLGKDYSLEGLQSSRNYVLARNTPAELSWLRHSRTCLRESNFFCEKALKSYDMAIDINPRVRGLWVNKSNVLRLLGRTDDAKAAFAKARELGYEG